MAKKKGGTGTPLRRLRVRAGGLNFDSTGRVVAIVIGERVVSPAEAVKLAEEQHDLEAISELLGFLANAMTMEHPVSISALPREVIAWGGHILGNLRNGETADAALELERGRGARKRPSSESRWSDAIQFEKVRALMKEGESYASAVEKVAYSKDYPDYRVSDNTIKRAYQREARRRYKNGRAPKIKRRGDLTK